MGVCIQEVGKRFRLRISADCLLCQILLDSCSFGGEDARERKVDGEDELQAFHFLSVIDVIDPNTLEFGDYRQTHPL